MKALIQSLYKLYLLVVILVVLTGGTGGYSLLISQLMVKAIPVRGAKFRKACFRAGFLLLCIYQSHPDISSEWPPVGPALHSRQRRVYVPVAYRSGLPALQTIGAP